MKRRSLKALFMSAVILGTILFSTVFVLKEAVHDCTGEDCPVCEVLLRCETGMRDPGTSPVRADVKQGQPVFRTVCTGNAAVIRTMDIVCIRRNTRLNL